MGLLGFQPTPDAHLVLQLLLGLQAFKARPAMSLLGFQPVPDAHLVLHCFGQQAFKARPGGATSA